MIKNSVYIYPAVFTKENDGGYSITFPDVDGCYTSGDDITDGLLMAKDVLALMIYNNYEDKDIPVPEPSPINKIKHGKDSFVTYIVCDTTEYRRRFSKRSVKKTLTIPEWLNEAALEEKLNFSQILQDALKERLHVS
jgi:predicted RNase H-like HicB family nuclease